MDQEFFSQANNFMILTCSECANGGQLANRTAEELSAEGYGRWVCLAAIGVPVSRLSSFIQSAAKDVSFIIAIDGCSKGCAKKVLDQAGLPIENYLVVTDHGIGKNKDINLTMEVIENFKVSVKNSLTGKGDAIFSFAT
jgi:uncharacterized metal-binding protein